MSILERIHSPADLKALPAGEIPELCAELRSFLVQSLSKTGGHLASNLGAVELTVAIDRVYNTERDRLVFDVGHQSYVHKLLTGRREAFSTLRQFGGDDQWSNMLGGTELIRRKLGKDAYAMTITLLTDSQGKKMGKTAGNAVWLDPNKTSPFEFYQYWRNVGDADVMKCIRMLTFLPLEQIDEMSTWKDQRLNEAKEILAYELTSMVHGKEEAEKAQNAARALFSGSAMDTEHMPSTQLTEADLTDGSIGILTLMVKAGLAASNGEARRLVVQGGVLVDGEKVAAPTVGFTAEQLAKGIVIKKGKKIYHKVTL